MILSREFVDAINEFIDEFHSKTFVDIDQLAESIKNLSELADKEQELDLVDINAQDLISKPTVSDG